MVISDLEHFEDVREENIVGGAGGPVFLGGSTGTLSIADLSGGNITTGTIQSVSNLNQGGAPVGGPGFQVSFGTTINLSTAPGPSDT